jgi:hypothetical protein
VREPAKPFVHECLAGHTAYHVEKGAFGRRDPERRGTSVALLAD